MKRLPRLLFALLLAACGTPSTDASGPIAPGIDGDAQAVDGLTVGNRLMEAGEFELARKAYLREAAQSGMTPEVLTALGTAALKLQRLGQAEDLFRRAIAADPDYVPARNNLGVVLMETSRVAEAQLGQVSGIPIARSPAATTVSIWGITPPRRMATTWAP